MLFKYTVQLSVQINDLLVHFARQKLNFLVVVHLTDQFNWLSQILDITPFEWRNDIIERRTDRLQSQFKFIYLNLFLVAAFTAVGKSRNDYLL